MSRKGNCLDNAVAENFFGLLKTEMYHRQNFKDADELIEKLDDHIEYYNSKRVKVKLKGLSPIEYRNLALQANGVTSFYQVSEFNCALTYLHLGGV